MKTYKEWEEDSPCCNGECRLHRGSLCSGPCDLYDKWLAMPHKDPKPTDREVNND